MPAERPPPAPAGTPWPAPAKLNLFLHLLGRRSDGYHDLQTLFQFLDYGDELRFAPRHDGRICRHGGLAGLDAADDLAVRAADALRAHAGAVFGVDIHLHKRLPAGGGLGGGSSDAATTLVALNAAWGLGLDTATLATIGARLGADVALFVRGQAALGEGRGERLTPLSLPQPWYLVLDPGVAVSTAAMFALPALRRDCPPVALEDYHAGRCINVFTAPVLQAYPAVAQAHAWLETAAAGALAPGVRLSGSGACLFAAFPERAAARRVLARVPAPWHAFVARGCNRSPLLARAGAARQGFD